VKPFIESFVRPHGLTSAATPLFADQVEAMKGLTPSTAKPEALAFFWRWTIDRLRALRHNERWDRWVLSEREQFVKRRNREAAALKAKQRRAARLAREAEEKGSTPRRLGD